MSSTQAFDRYGEPYTLSRVIDSSFHLNETAYEAYSPLYIPATYSTVYSIAFALSTSAIIHTALYHGKSILNRVKNVRGEAEDVHAKLMRYYPEVPDWWYWSILVVTLSLSCVAIEVGFAVSSFGVEGQEVVD